MSIPNNVKVKNGVLPDEPGVYFHKNEAGDILYIGKATSLRNRVNSYFSKAHDNRIAEMVSKVREIDYIITPTVIEALVLEANQIKKHKPPYNVMLRDDKSFLYLCITNETYPKPLLLRGHDIEKFGVKPFDAELSERGKKKFLAVYGPYTSGGSLRKALEYVRRFIPWSDCEPPSVTGKARPCFYRHIRKCPGVCTGEIDRKTYRSIIRDLMDFFDGKKERIIKRLKKEMETLAKEKRFEEAAILRNKLFALEHIQDIALISREDVELPYAKRVHDDAIDLEGRIEAYDISNISGTSAVGSMVVFEEGRPAKEKYRKFKIKTVVGPDDFAMMKEVLTRRLKRSQTSPKAWPLPEIMVIDGGLGQIGKVYEVMKELGVHVPVIGIAKGFDRKQDRLMFDRSDTDILAIAQRGKELFQRARDESHRFAVKYHRVVRRKTSGIPKKKRVV